MSTPTKVIIEIDSKSHVVKVFAGDEVIVTRKMNMVGRGRAVGEKGQPDIEESLIDYPKLAEEIADISLGIFGVACELSYIADEYGLEDWS